jgi:LmbE family N-acetylglucosaminyl deacetylase
MQRCERLVAVAATAATCLASTFGSPARAQTISRGSYSGTGSGLDLMDVEIMFVGAHPDDDTGVLATFARYLRDEGFKGTVITLTGGEGGGNAIGREAGRSLGLIREEEERRSLLVAGVTHPHFLGLRDFYFTLSAEEAQALWGDRFVCDVVRHVRLARPEVLVTMWPGPGTHGQHQMAARAATLAYEKAGDAGYCPEQVTREFLRPFVPLKLYYFPGGRKGEAIVSVPTTDFSRSAAMRYADLKALLVSQYRSQGYEQPIPAPKAEPESFLLARSRVPVAEPETHLLAGALLPIGASPAGVRLEVDPVTAEVTLGRELDVRVEVGNTTGATLRRVALGLEVPEGWTAHAQGPVEAAALALDESLQAVFRVTPPATAVVGGLVPLAGTYSAESGSGALSGRNRAWVRPVPAVRASWKPLFDVAGYREFARQTRTEWVLPTLPARVPVVVGRANPVIVEVENGTGESAKGELAVEAPPGVSAGSRLYYAVPAGGRTEAPLTLEVDPTALPEGRHSAKLKVALLGLAAQGREEADLYVLPGLRAPRTPKPVLVDGDLSDMEGLARGSISPKDRWWRAEPKDAADLSSDFFVGYDTRYLYVGVRVRDEVVACNIAPNDIKAQLRSDAVGVTVDPSGKSRDTSTTFQAAAFPCTTTAFGARGFRDADARPGVMEETAPGMQVASRQTADGYEIEFALPFGAMPAFPRPGDEIGLNVVLYDGDQKDARPGANISESGLAWAAFELGGKQALPYLWPRVILAR